MVSAQLCQYSEPFGQMCGCWQGKVGEAESSEQGVLALFQLPWHGRDEYEQGRAGGDCEA